MQAELSQFVKAQLAAVNALGSAISRRDWALVKDLHAVMASARPGGLAQQQADEQQAARAGTFSKPMFIPAR